MANKSLFSSLKSLLPRAQRAQRGRRPGLPAAGQACAGAVGRDGLLQRHLLRRRRGPARHAAPLIAAGGRQPFLAKLAIYSRERALHEGHAGGAAGHAVEARPAAVPPRVRPRRRQRPRAAHAVADDPLGPVRPQEPVGSLQRAFQRWLNSASVEKLLSASIGNDPSLRDVLRLARPTPTDNARRALFGWLTDKPVEKWAPATEADLPEQVRPLAAYRAGRDGRGAG